MQGAGSVNLQANFSTNYSGIYKFEVPGTKIRDSFRGTESW